MDFFLKLAAFILLVSVVQSKETVRDVKSFEVNENITYDCVDIYKQPSLSHPLLKNHKIQMKPSFLNSKPKDQINYEKEKKKEFECPEGRVPIMRNTNKYSANAQSTAIKHFNVLTVDSPGTHIAGVSPQGQGPFRGLASSISVHDLNISRDQISYAYIYLGSGVNNKVNYIETGWMVNPSLFGDGRTWRYGFWKGANGAGCYNTICSGFIQVSKTDPLSGPIPYPSKGERAIEIALQQDKESGNWWTSDVRVNAPDIQIGYWPKELFDLIDDGVSMVGVTGAVQASHTGQSPPMGNGHLPTDDDLQSARVYDLEIIDSSFNIKGSNKYRLDKLIDSEKCYGIKDGKKSVLFTFGGPGGDSCGI